MTLAEQALAAARAQSEGPADSRTRVIAWDRLRSLVSALDSKTSVLLRFESGATGALTEADVRHLRLVYARDMERLADLTGLTFS